MIQVGERLQGCTSPTASSRHPWSAVHALFEVSDDPNCRLGSSRVGVQDSCCSVVRD